MARLLKSARGFTLIELLIVVAIVGILAAIALTSYRAYVIRSNRSAAEAEMMQIANLEQQYLLANRAYADATTLNYSLPSSVSANYSYQITVGNGTVPSFTITFTAINNQVSDGDLSLASDGTKSPANKW
jgi:type IV pilus assembly protein PilE